MMFDAESLQRHFRFCWALTQNQADAQDLLQTAVEKVLRRPPKDQTKIHAYLRTVIRRSLVDDVRKQSAVGFDSIDNVISLESDFDLEKVVINQDELGWLWPKLDSVEQEILFLWALEGMTYAEISQELAVPRGTILAKIHRLRARIEQLVMQHSGGAQCQSR